MILVVTLLLIQRNILLRNVERFQTAGGKSVHGRLVGLGKWRWPLSALVGGSALAFVVLPIAGLMLASVTKLLTPLVPPWELLTANHYRRVWETASFRRAIRNSITIGVVGAACVTMFVGFATLVAHRSRFAVRKSMPPLLLYPTAVPGLILGLGFFWFFASIGSLRPLLGSIWIVGIALAVRQVALSYGALFPAAAAIAPELDQAAAASGATWVRTAWRILLPLMRNALLASFLVVFVAILNDYDPAIFIASTGSEVMSLTMLRVWTQGFVGPVAALGVIQLLITAVVVVVGRSSFGVRGRHDA